MKRFNPEGTDKMWFPDSKENIRQHIQGWLSETQSSHTVDEVMKTAKLVDEPLVMGKVFEVPCEHFTPEEKNK